MTAYEKAVIKAFFNEVYGQMCAEVDGQTIIPGYADTDSSYPENRSEERYETVNKNYNAKEVNRDLACTQIENMIYKIAFVCTGGHRTLTNDERWLVNNAVNELMAMFTGYTIAEE